MNITVVNIVKFKNQYVLDSLLNIINVDGISNFFSNSFKRDLVNIIISLSSLQIHLFFGYFIINAIPTTLLEVILPMKVDNFYYEKHFQIAKQVHSKNGLIIINTQLLHYLRQLKWMNNNNQWDSDAYLVFGIKLYFPVNLVLRLL